MLRGDKNIQGHSVLLLLISLCLTCFFVWAGVTKIDQHVRGTGKVIPAGKIRTIQHLENAIIREILVKEGQAVQAGDVLFNLTNTRAEAEMKEIDVAMNALLLKQTRLKAEFNQAKVLDFSANTVAGYDNIKEAGQELFLARRAELNEKIDGLKKRMKQKVLRLDDLETNVKNLAKERSVAQEQLKIKKRLRATGAVSRSQYLETESEVKNFNTRISQVQKEIPIVKSEISEIVNLLEETKQNWRSKIVEELNTVNIDLKKLGERVVTYSDAVSRTAILAPINGVVNKLHVNTIGGVIQSGQVLAEIIPLEEKLVVEGRISLQDRGKIWVGLPVAAKITAYDYSIYGGLKGELTYISADSFVDNQGIGYYLVKVTLEKTKMSEEKPIFPGMSVDLNILANKISILHALLKPLTQIRENALREL